jgi:hypothetical protein
LTEGETVDQLFEHVAATVTVDGTEFHQIRYTAAEQGYPADVMYGTAQWDAHVADNTEPIGPIIVVYVSEQARDELVQQVGAPTSARSAAVDPYAPIEPDAESPSGEEQRLVVVPPPVGSGSLVFAMTGVDDAAARAFAEAVTR